MYNKIVIGRIKYVIKIKRYVNDIIKIYQLLFNNNLKIRLLAFIHCASVKVYLYYRLPYRIGNVSDKINLTHFLNRAQI